MLIWTNVCLALQLRHRVKSLICVKRGLFNGKSYCFILISWFHFGKISKISRGNIMSLACRGRNIVRSLVLLVNRYFYRPFFIITIALRLVRPLKCFWHMRNHLSISLIRNIKLLLWLDRSYFISSFWLVQRVFEFVNIARRNQFAFV